MQIEDLDDGRLVRMYMDVRSQLRDSIIGRSSAMAVAGDGIRGRIRTVDDLHAHRRAVRAGFLASLGGSLERSDLQSIQVNGVVDRGGYRIEKVVGSPSDGVYITGSLYVPDGIRRPVGAVLYLCGHNHQGKAAGAFQRACHRLVSAGMVVLALDPIGQGERCEYYDVDGGFHAVAPGTVSHDHMGSQCLPVGDGLARYFLRDAMCGISMLLSRPEVDPGRIGVNGYSGGGTQTAMLMIMDDRIAAAAPGVFISDRMSVLRSGGCQDAEQVWFGAAARGFDHQDVLLAMAPRRIKVLAARWDFFPIEGTRRSVKKAVEILERIGMGGCIELYEEDSEHACTDGMSLAAAEFFSSCFSSGEEVQTGSFHPLPAESLWSTSGGQVNIDHPLCSCVHGENMNRLSLVRSRDGVSDPDFIPWLSGCVSGVRERCEAGLRLIARDGHYFDMRFELGFWWSQPGVANVGVMFRGDSRSELPVTIALWEGGSCRVRDHAEWLMRECRAGKAVLVLDPSGEGACAPNQVNPYAVDGFYGTSQWVSDGLMWLGDSPMAMRTHDVLRSLDVLASWPGIDAGSISGFAAGRGGYPLILAGVLDARIRQVDCDLVPAMSEVVTGKYYDHSRVREFVMPGLLRFGDRDDFINMVNGRGAR